MAKKIWNSQGLGVKSEVVTPSDAGANEFDLLYIGNTDLNPESAGNLKVKLREDSDFITFYNILPGEFPHSVKAVHTDTTCTNIIGLTKGKD